MDYEICPGCAFVLDYGDEEDTGDAAEDARRLELCEPWTDWTVGYEEHWGGNWCHICGNYSDNYYILER